MSTIFDSYALEQASVWTASRMGLYRQARDLAHSEQLASRNQSATGNDSSTKRTIASTVVKRETEKNKK